jgi:hypothetical protein
MTGWASVAVLSLAWATLLGGELYRFPRSGSLWLEHALAEARAPAKAGSLTH